MPVAGQTCAAAPLPRQPAGQLQRCRAAMRIDMAEQTAPAAWRPSQGRMTGQGPDTVACKGRRGADTGGACGGAAGTGAPCRGGHAEADRRGPRARDSPAPSAVAAPAPAGPFRRRVMGQSDEITGGIRQKIGPRDHKARRIRTAPRARLPYLVFAPDARLSGPQRPQKGTLCETNPATKSPPRQHKS